jgi:hypothetical protein
MVVLLARVLCAEIDCGRVERILRPPEMPLCLSSMRLAACFVAASMMGWTVDASETVEPGPLTARFVYAPAMIRTLDAFTLLDSACSRHVSTLPR